MNTNLTHVVLLIRKLRERVLVILLGLGFVAVLVFSYQLSQKVPEAEKIQTPVFPEGSEKLKGPISGLEKLKILSSLPASLEIYRPVATGDFLSEEEVLKIAKALGFGENWEEKLEEEKGLVYLFVDFSSGKILTVSTTPPSFSLSVDPTVTPYSEGTLPSEEQAKSAAQKILIELEVNDLSYLAGSYRLVEADPAHFEIVSSPADANSVEVLFTPKLKEFSILGATPLEGAASFILDARNVLFSLKYSELPSSFEELKSVPLRDPNQAIADLKKGKGVVVYGEAFVGGSLYLDSNRLTSFSPSQMFLAYYMGRDNLLQPVYVFQGKGQLVGSRGEEVWATVYLPAVEEKYLK